MILHGVCITKNGRFYFFKDDSIDLFYTALFFMFSQFIQQRLEIKKKTTINTVHAWSRFDDTVFWSPL